MCLGALGVIDEVWSEGGVPMASIDGEPVCVMYTPGASVGDTVLVHLGFSVEMIEEQRAEAALALRSELALEVREETV
jgi:hydrogenase expression/formation protein HypC